MYNVENLCIYPYYDEELLPYCTTQFDADFMKKYIYDVSTDEIRNSLYQANFLESFNLNEFNEEIVNDELNRLYNLLLNDDRFKECMKILANSCMSEDLYVGLMILFSYDYFFLTHTCICEYLQNNNMPSLKKLEEYIKKKTTK